MLCSSLRSARLHAFAFQLHDNSARRILNKDLNFQPYKIQMTHKLTERDEVNRLWFSNEFLNLINGNQHTSIFRIMLMSRIISTGPQNTIKNFINVLYTVKR